MWSHSSDTQKALGLGTMEQKHLIGSKGQRRSFSARSSCRMGVESALIEGSEMWQCVKMEGEVVAGSGADPVHRSRGECPVAEIRRHCQCARLSSRLNRTQCD